MYVIFVVLLVFVALSLGKEPDSVCVLRQLDDEVAGVVRLAMHNESVSVTYSLDGLAAPLVVDILDDALFVPVEVQAPGLVQFVLPFQQGNINVSNTEWAQLQGAAGKSMVARRMEDTDQILASCTIGTTGSNLAMTGPQDTMRAHCYLRGTVSYPDIRGWVDITQHALFGTQVRSVIYGLPPGEHPWHIHELGDVSQTDASSTGGHFGRNCACRDTGLDEVGDIGGGHVLMFDEERTSVSFLRDDILQLTGNTSIVGRSIVLHDANNGFARAAQCVIGIRRQNEVDLMENNRFSSLLFRNERPVGYMDFSYNSQSMTATYMLSGLQPNAVYHARTLLYPEQEDDTIAMDEDVIEIFSDNAGVALGQERQLGVSMVSPGYAVDIVSEETGEWFASGGVGRVQASDEFGEPALGTGAASCSILHTSSSRLPVEGYIYFSSTELGVMVDYRVTGLTPGFYPWHVHTDGDVLDLQHAQAVQGHFIGTPETRAEVGQLDDDTPIQAGDDGVAAGYFLDSEIQLRGRESILGRSIILHDSDGSRIGQCIIQNMDSAQLQVVDPEPTVLTQRSSNAYNFLAWPPGLLAFLSLAFLAGAAASIQFIRKTSAPGAALPLRQ